MWEINCLLATGFSIAMTAVLIAIRPVYPAPFLHPAGPSRRGGAGSGAGTSGRPRRSAPKIR